MKYHFLGDMECPSWLLEEVCTNFSNITVLTFESLCKKASQLILYGSSSSRSGPTSRDDPNCHANLVLIGNWLLLKPAGYECPSEDLEKEVVQLGLPPEHGRQLKKVYEMYRDELRKKASDSIHKEPHGTLLSSGPNSFRMQIGPSAFDISTSSALKEQLLSHLKNGIVKMKALSETLPEHPK